MGQDSRTVDDLVAFMRRLGTTGSEEGDGLSALDHGLQCALELRGAKPGDLELQVAGLVHDVGHCFGPDDLHGELGAAQVRGLLGDRVADLVAAHVPAKRYLVAVDPSYASSLSATSTWTLGHQGGALSEEEARRFEGTAHFDDALLLRRADEAAKVGGRAVPGLDDWVEALEAVWR